MDMNIIKLSVHNNQEAFDKAARHLKRQPQRAMVLDSSTCVYETEDGKNNCVVGALLVLDTPEKHKWAKAVRSTIRNLLRGEPNIYNAVHGVGSYTIDQNGVDPSLLSNLQQVHDDRMAWGPSGFTGWDRMRAVAQRWNLNTKVLDALGV